MQIPVRLMLAAFLAGTIQLPLIATASHATHPHPSSKWHLTLGARAHAKYLSSLYNSQFIRIDDVLNEDRERVLPHDILEEIAANKYARFHGGVALILGLEYRYHGTFRVEAGIGRRVGTSLAPDYTWLQYGSILLDDYEILLSSLGVHANGTATVKEAPLSIEYITPSITGKRPVEVKIRALLDINWFETSITREGHMIAGVMTVRKDGETVFETSKPIVYWRNRGTETAFRVGPQAVLEAGLNTFELSILPGYSSTRHTYTMGMVGVDSWSLRDRHSGSELSGIIGMTRDFRSIRATLEVHGGLDRQSARLALSTPIR